jgi:hypothetical protein
VNPVAQSLPIHSRQPRGRRPVHPVQRIGERDQPGADPAVVFAPRLSAQLVRADIVPDRKSSHCGIPLLQPQNLLFLESHNTACRNPPSRVNLNSVWYYTVREYIQAGIAGCHIEDQIFPPKSGPRRRCISIPEMVGKLRAAMDAKEAQDPDFVIMARCDLGGVPGASFAEIIERCQAYKAEAQVDVICPNGLRTWEEIEEAIRLIPGPVVPLIPADLSPYPSLQAQQDAGAAAAWFPALTTMAGLQANWDFLSDFQQRGTLALDAHHAQAAQSPWGVASNGRILDEPRLRSMEEMYLPD